MGGNLSRICTQLSGQTTVPTQLRVRTDDWEWSPGQLSRQWPVVCLEFGTPVLKVVTTKFRSLFRGLGDDLWQHACERIIFFEIFHNFQKKGKKIIRSHACCHRSSPNPLNTLRDFVVTSQTLNTLRASVGTIVPDFTPTRLFRPLLAHILVLFHVTTNVPKYLKNYWIKISMSYLWK